MVGRFFVGATYSETLYQYQNVDKMSTNIRLEIKGGPSPGLP